MGKSLAGAGPTLASTRVQQTPLCLISRQDSQGLEATLQFFSPRAHQLADPVDFAPRNPAGNDIV
jgi:hypothetical protein